MKISVGCGQREPDESERNVSGGVANKIGKGGRNWAALSHLNCNAASCPRDSEARIDGPLGIGIG